MHEAEARGWRRPHVSTLWSELPWRCRLIHVDTCGHGTAVVALFSRGMQNRIVQQVEEMRNGESELRGASSSACQKCRPCRLRGGKRRMSPQ